MNNFSSGQAYLDSGAVAGGYRAKITYNSRDLNGRVIKLTPPKPGVPDLAAADDTGSSNTNNRTNQTSALTISGMAEADSTVTTWEGYTSKATANAHVNVSSAKADDERTITLSGFSGEGTIRLHIDAGTARDLAGNDAEEYTTALELTVTAKGMPVSAVWLLVLLPAAGAATLRKRRSGK